LSGSAGSRTRPYLTPSRVDTAVWLASSPDAEGVSGKFFELRKEIPCQFRNAELEEQLWAACDRLAGLAP
jgi:hypothetical protein